MSCKHKVGSLFLARKGVLGKKTLFCDFSTAASGEFLRHCGEFLRHFGEFLRRTGGFLRRNGEFLRHLSCKSLILISENAPESYLNPESIRKRRQAAQIQVFVTVSKSRYDSHGWS